jgi:hypothetical protein
VNCSTSEADRQNIDGNDERPNEGKQRPHKHRRGGIHQAWISPSRYHSVQRKEDTDQVHDPL